MAGLLTNLGRGLNPTVGNSFVDKTLPGLVTLIVAVLVWAQMNGIVPTGKWSGLLDIVVGFLNGAYVHSAGANAPPAQ